MKEAEDLADVLGPIGELAAHAIRYAEAGLDIFPVNPTNKTPLVSQKTATTDTTIVETWWETWPTALIGHRISPDHVILDVDPRHGGLDTWKALRDTHGIIPRTRYHASGRGDGGGHLWFIRPDDKLSATPLDAWAKEHGTGHPIDDANGKQIRWSGGIDVLQHDHRYTILPPSPHPDTHEPYHWKFGLDIEPVPMPAWLADLITDSAPPAPPRPPAGPPDPDSIADWYTATNPFSRLLPHYGWTLRAGNGDDDGSRWKHPAATSSFSATVRHGYLFVYSPNTPLEPTTPGSPHGYSPFAIYGAYEHRNDLKAAARAARRLRDGETTRDNYDDLTITPVVDPETGEIIEPTGPKPIVWSEFWNREHVGEDWIVEPLIPRGRQVALWATHKTGKSLLSLEVAAAVATGRPCLAQDVSNPTHVIYIDLEMTEDDLHDRLAEMGYGPDDDLDHLHYYLLPSLPPLDSAEGGAAVVALVDRHQAELVVVDTMARAVQGDENDADTYRSFYRHTGLQLKQRGCALIRLDHAGKDPTKGQRGSSSKGDDVDVVWQLRLQDEGLSLRRTAARMSWVPESVNLRRTEDPLRHTLTDGLWPAGTKEASDEFDRLQIDPTLSQTKAIAAFKQAGGTGKTDVLRKGWKHWQEQRLGGLR